MASKTTEDRENSEKDAVYVGRLVYDVLAYTLPKCGFPETGLPPPDSEENVYKRANFVEIAGVSALRVSLLMRDKWNRMFTSRAKSSGFSKKGLPLFLEKVAICCPLSWPDTTQSVVNASFALCIEIVMFFHHEGIGIDLNTVINSISEYLRRVVQSNRNVSETMEELFDYFGNISEYTRWVTEFITNFAIPYGSRKDVSELFFERVKKQWKEDIKKISCPETLSITQLRDYIGFLPNELFEVMVFEETEDLTETEGSVLGLTLSAIPESPEPTELPENSEPSSMQSTRSADISEQAAQGRIEQGETSLGSEGVSYKSQAKKRKKSKKKGKHNM